MFFHLTRERAVLISLFAGALIIALAAFLYANAAWALVVRGEEYSKMASSELLYRLLYRPADYGGVTTPVRGELPAQSVPVLVYHGEGSNSEYEMPTAVFVDQMRAMHKAGWTTITMRQFDDWMQGKADLPDKSFMLTFDDGRKDTYYLADPILRDRGFHAVMFAITALSLPEDEKTSRYYLGPVEFTDMLRTGRWEVQSHGHADHAGYTVRRPADAVIPLSETGGHFLSNLFWNEAESRFETEAEYSTRIFGDLTISKEMLEKRFGTSVTAFAYPFNDYGKDTVNFSGAQALLDTIVPHVYRYAFYQVSPRKTDLFNYRNTNNGPGASPYMIKRFEPSPSWSGEDLVNLLNEGRIKSLPYAGEGFGTEWGSTWGSVSFAAGGKALIVSAATSTTGGSAFLKGAGEWTDYETTASVHWVSGRSFSLLSRVGGNGSVACSYTAGKVTLSRHQAGAQQIAGEVSRPFTGSREAIRVGMRVRGQDVVCLENDLPMVAGTITGMAQQGAVGLEVWDSATGTARSELLDFAVQRYESP